MNGIKVALMAFVAAFIFVVVGVTGWSVGRGAGAANTSGGAMQPASAHLYLTVATPAMLGTDVGPAVLPGQATVPANTDVTLTIYNFDDVTPLTGPYVAYAKAQGIEGKFTSAPMDKGNPNGPPTGAATAGTSVDPSLVSHTFTIPSLKINVPLLASSRTTFTFHTGGAGTFEWHCMDPCGTGPAGWSGAMSQQGYMGGKLTVA